MLIVYLRKKFRNPNPEYCHNTESFKHYSQISNITCVLLEHLIPNLISGAHIKWSLIFITSSPMFMYI